MTEVRLWDLTYEAQDEGVEMVTEYAVLATSAEEAIVKVKATYLTGHRRVDLTAVSVSYPIVCTKRTTRKKKPVAEVRHEAVAPVLSPEEGGA